MNTPSHLIINAALRKRFGQTVPIARSFLLGAVLPDIPLWLLWMGGYAYYRYILADPTVTLMDQRFDDFYFTNRFWIAGHNMLHAPIPLLLALALLWRFRAAPGGKGHWWFWFAAGCLVHTAIDIPTHVNDGPLLLFPFEWSLRFRSPVSYWDPRHFGRQFAIFELLLNLALLVYLLGPWFRGWVQRWRAVTRAER